MGRGVWLAMRIIVIGAGAVGTYIAAKLASAKADVGIVARGRTLDAIRARGIRVEGNEQIATTVHATVAGDAGPGDLVISCVKAFALPAVATDIAGLLLPGGSWMCVVNGLPWWYGVTPLQSVDPDGRIRALIPVERIIGCAAYLRSEVLEPGVVSYTGGRGLIVGQADGSRHASLASFTEMASVADLAVALTDDIRTAVWNKFFGNVALNPVTALAGCTVEQTLADPGLRQVLLDVTGEAMAVALAEGAVVESDVAARVAAMAPLGAFRTSMLQDVDAGRTIELDAILGALIEVADRAGVAVPASRRLYAEVRAFARSRGLMPA